MKSKFKKFRIAMAAMLCFGMANQMGFADPLLTATTTSTTPVISANTATTTTTTTTNNTSTTTNTSGDFLMSSALSTATTGSTTTTQNGRTVYVSNSGSNTSDGSQGTPWQSLDYAVTQLKAGDTLVIQSGTYTLSKGAKFTTSGTADAHITVQAAGDVILDGKNLYSYTPVFDTGGQNYIDFKGLTVQNARSAVSVTGDSSNILIDGLHTDHNQMAVIIDQGSYVTVQNSVAANSRNAFVANNTSNHLTFQNVEAYGSEDIYSGYETLYRNGDGFIMNLGTHDVVFRNIISHDNWDGGIDSKAVNTLIDGAILYSNKNNMKIWADTTVMNTISFGARILTDDPVSGEGNGLNARTGNITVLNSIFFDNGNHDIQVDAQGPASNVTVENSIFYRNLTSGKQVDLVGGTFHENNNIFYWAGKTSSPEFTLSGTSKWVDPKLVDATLADLPLVNNTTDHTRDNELVRPKIDLHLTSASQAINAGLNNLVSSQYDLDGLTRIMDSTVDLGAYEYQTVSNPVDTTAPAISAVASNNVTQTGASIAWTTNEASDSQVQYRVKGSTTWNKTALDASMVTSHSVVLSGLTAGTQYEYQVMSKDTAGNLATQSTISSFTTASSGTTPPPSTTCTTEMCGMTSGQTVSGTVQVQPNLTMNTDIRKVSYYLNGSLSTREYTSPFIWGTTGFDTTKLADGNYTLSGAYTTASGDHNFSLSFTVKNSSTTQDTTAPVISAVASGNVTQNAAAITWTTNEASDSQVQYRVKGSTSWISVPVNTSMVTSHSVVLSGLTAGTQYEYQVMSKDAAGNLATQSTISSFTTSAATTACTTAMCGMTSGQTVSGTVQVQPNLTMNTDIRKVSYYLNGSLSTREYTSPFIWGTTGFDTTKLADGNYTLSGAYTTAAGDQAFSIAFTVKNSSTTQDTTAPVISAVASSNVTQNAAAITWTTNEASDSQVQYRVKGSTTWISVPVNTAMVTSHSVALSGLTAGTQYEYQVMSKDAAGNLATQSTISSFTTSTATTACTTAMCGVTGGQTVSGTIFVQPSATLAPTIKKISYYLNGTKLEVDYTSPFTLGGTAGFDTKKLANGTYTLAGAYTTAAGDIPFTVTFTVQN